MNDNLFYFSGIATAFLIGQVETSDFWLTLFKEFGSLSIVAYVVWYGLRKIGEELKSLTLKVTEMKSEMETIHNLEDDKE